jgi:diadenosine tetraphosphatase ApaH/serine/threonine PP2A family protein phosphatase
MRILVFSDIHANLTALQTVIKNAGPVDQTWCLGDIVGYGPDPNECVSILRNIDSLCCIMGNHDAAVCETIAIEAFNPDARQSIYWTRLKLSSTNLEWLKLLPERIELESATLAHGSPRNPIWEYLLDPITALHSFKHFSTPACFVGHTHLPIAYQLLPNQRMATWNVPQINEPMKLNGRMIINPGSVGQPRDHDPRAAYGIFDTEGLTWEQRRVDYHFQEVQERIIAAGLPEKHAQRLTNGW